MIIEFDTEHTLSPLDLNVHFSAWAPESELAWGSVNLRNSITRIIVDFDAKMITHPTDIFIDFITHDPNIKHYFLTIKKVTIDNFYSGDSITYSNKRYDTCESHVGALCFNNAILQYSFKYPFVRTITE